MGEGEGGRRPSRRKNKYIVLLELLQGGQWAWTSQEGEKTKFTGGYPTVWAFQVVGKCVGCILTQIGNIKSFKQQSNIKLHPFKEIPIRCVRRPVEGEPGESGLWHATDAGAGDGGKWVALGNILEVHQDRHCYLITGIPRRCCGFGCRLPQ